MPTRTPRAGRATAPRKTGIQQKVERLLRERDALDDPTKGPDMDVLLTRLIESLESERRSALNQAIRECNGAVRTATSIRERLQFALTNPEGNVLSALGENQGNAGKHIDSYTIQAYAISQQIDVLKGLREVVRERQQT